MAKGYDKGRSARRGGDDFYRDPQAELARKLGEIVSDLYLSTDESDIKRLWSSAHRLLLKSTADPARIEAVMKQRRIGALSTVAQELVNSASKGPAMRSTIKPQTESSAGAVETISSLQSTGAAPAAAATPVEPSPSSPAANARTPSPDQLKSAMKAFRKRLKLTKLDDESKLGARAMTGGRQSKVVAIMPPREYPVHVWEELARQGKLRNTGRGFYELVGE